MATSLWLLVRLAKQLDDKAQARIEKTSGGTSVGELGKGLVAALDADKIIAAALATAKANGITRSEDTLTADEIAAARATRVAAACQPFDKPGLGVRKELGQDRTDKTRHPALGADGRAFWHSHQRWRFDGPVDILERDVGGRSGQSRPRPFAPAARQL